MRILHTSDLHLNSGMKTVLSREKAKERRRELMLGFREMAERAERLGCRAFIIAGDLFDTAHTAERIRREAMDIISAKPSISFFYLAGNHEKDSVSSMRELPENLHIFGDGWTQFMLDGIAFIGRGETNADMFSELTLPEGARHTVLILHGELRERSECGGVIGRRELERVGADYIALGHYHSYAEERLGAASAVYSGTPMGRGFDECGEKGFVLIDTDGVRISHSFIPLPGRRIHIADIPADGAEKTSEIAARIEEKTRDFKREDIVRVRLIGRVKPGVKFDTDAIVHRFSDKFYHFEAEDETRLLISPEDYENDRSLKGEFIRLVLSSDKLSEREKSDIISCGLSALMGEELFS